MAYRYAKDHLKRITGKETYNPSHINGRYLTESAEQVLVEYHGQLIDKPKNIDSLMGEETFFKVKMMRLV
jgi:hypothetical protein